MISAIRFHDISVGHTVTGHESKCAHLHGHNYRVHFKIKPVETLDSVGRVIDFSVIKTQLCVWLEQFWDHKFLIWREDPRFEKLMAIDPDGVRGVAFNPTAENMANYLLEKVGPTFLPPSVKLVEVKIEETYKCSVEASLDR